MSRNNDFCFVQYNGYTKQEGVNNLNFQLLRFLKKKNL
jgi:hypothetical protein